MSENQRLATAREAVRAAAAVCRTVQSSLDGSTQTKDDRSPVTVADYGAQAVVAYHLQRADPAIPIVGEENADALRAEDAVEIRSRVVAAVQQQLPELDEAGVLSAVDACADGGGDQGLRWVLDPIDGTKGYLRRDQYAVALGLLEDGVPVLGVLGCPNLPCFDGSTGTLFLADCRRGMAIEQSLDTGAERDVTVSDVTDPALANFCESVESGHSSHERHQRIATALGTAEPSFRIDSQCKYGAVARGQASIYLRLPTSATYQEKIWDHAAGVAVVQAAGGRVTDIHGRDLNFRLGRKLTENRGVVATNGTLHGAVIEAIRTTTLADDPA